MVRAILTCICSLATAATVVAEPWVITEQPVKSVWVITEAPPRPPVPPLAVPRPAVALTSRTVCTTGYCWKYSNGGVINETFAEYRKRTGKNPPEARMQCSTGFCSMAARTPTLATGGCTCGCNASLCGCHHSPNVGKPLAKQTVNPGVAYNQLRRQIQWR